MRKSLVLAPAVLLTFALAGLSPAFAQDEVSPGSLPNSLNDSPNAAVLLTEAEPAASLALPAAPSAPAVPAAAPAPEPGSSPRVGIGVMVGTLGVGGQVAVRVLRPLNIRAGFSGLGIGYNFNNDGIDYGAHLRLEGAPVTADFFFFHGIHVSGGGLLYNGTRITGTAAVSSGTTFTLNNVTYESSTHGAGCGDSGRQLPEGRTDGGIRIWQPGSAWEQALEHHLRFRGGFHGIAQCGAQFGRAGVSGGNHFRPDLPERGYQRQRTVQRSGRAGQCEQ